MQFSNFLTSAMAMAFFMVLISSCSKDQFEQSDSLQVTEEVKDKVEGLFFNIDDMVVDEITYPDGTTDEVFKVENDIVFTPEQLEEMIKNFVPFDQELNERQYRTNNLVSNNQTITVCGYTGGGGYGLSNKMRTALSWAVNNYNALNTGLNFSLTYTTNYQPYEMVVYRIPNGQAGGVAGFPSGGNPYKWIQIFSGMDNYDTNTVEHVITHEMGHAVGLRHTDWFSRQSCGQSGESAGPDGAVHIPGTPTGYDSNSVMLACFSSNEDGEFGFYDRVALEFLY
ncbi:M57 family metalloprotease [Portibacter marinus]|uniref:M57 family metalloprotease n=1 Tax=Portibacter marinus TaxID=2898660 RepID=UPI001F2ED922|nr:M57 family metalloprotease [Portibacter marinus]